MNAKYNPGSVFQGIIVNKKHEHFPKLPHVQQLINIFENLHDNLRVTEVWFLNSFTTMGAYMHHLFCQAL